MEIDVTNAAEKAKARRVQALLYWLIAGFIVSPLAVYWLLR